jgi:hypothetical protein
LKKLFLLGVLVCLIQGASFCGVTSLFYGGGVINVDQPNLKIGRIYGLRMTPTNITVNSTDQDIYIPHVIENLGNTTNLITVEIESLSVEKGWSAELIVDKNRNSRHESWENDNIRNPVELSEGATFSFFVKMVRPADYKYGDSGYAVIKVGGVAKGSVGYVGYNGVYYGGPDDAESTDTVMIK